MPESVLTQTMPALFAGGAWWAEELRSYHPDQGEIYDVPLCHIDFSLRLRRLIRLAKLTPKRAVGGARSFPARRGLPRWNGRMLSLNQRKAKKE